MPFFDKEVLTTGEVAKICNVAPRTVSKWFDTGRLEGYRIPGSKDRRIPVTALMQFMKDHNIPLDGVHSGRPRVLIVDDDTSVTQALTQHLTDSAGYDARSALSTFEAGMECEKFRPHVILLNIHMGDSNPAQFTKLIRSNEDLAFTRVIAMSSKLTDGQAVQLRAQGYEGFLKKPFAVRNAIEEIERVHALVH